MRYAWHSVISVKRVRCIPQFSRSQYGAFILSALSLAFILLLWLGHWTGVDEVPHLLNGLFEADPFYIDSLLKTFCDASTPDPFVDRRPLNFEIHCMRITYSLALLLPRNVTASSMCAARSLIAGLASMSLTSQSSKGLG